MKKIKNNKQAMGLKYAVVGGEYENGTVFKQNIVVSRSFSLFS